MQFYYLVKSIGVSRHDTCRDDTVVKIFLHIEQLGKQDLPLGWMQNIDVLRWCLNTRGWQFKGGWGLMRLDSMVVYPHTCTQISYKNKNYFPIQIFYLKVCSSVSLSEWTFHLFSNCFVSWIWPLTCLNTPGWGPKSKEWSSMELNAKKDQWPTLNGCHQSFWPILIVIWWVQCSCWRLYGVWSRISFDQWDVTHAQWCDAEGRRIFSRIRLFIEFASIVSLRILEDFEQVPVSKLFLGSWRFWKHARVMISLLELLFSFGQLGRLGVIEEEIWGMSCLHFCVVTLRFSKCRSSYSNWCV